MKTYFQFVDPSKKFEEEQFVNTTTCFPKTSETCNNPSSRTHSAHHSTRQVQSSDPTHFVTETIKHFLCNAQSEKGIEKLSTLIVHYWSKQLVSLQIDKIVIVDIGNLSKIDLISLVNKKQFLPELKHLEITHTKFINCGILCTLFRSVGNKKLVKLTYSDNSFTDPLLTSASFLEKICYKQAALMSLTVDNIQDLANVDFSQFAVGGMLTCRTLGSKAINLGNFEYISLYNKLTVKDTTVLVKTVGLKQIAVHFDSKVQYFKKTQMYHKFYCFPIFATLCLVEIPVDENQMDKKDAFSLNYMKIPSNKSCNNKNFVV